MNKKQKISMVKYDSTGNVIIGGVAYGEYKSEDVEIFRKSGFVDVPEEVARKAEEGLLEKLNGVIDFSKLK